MTKLVNRAKMYTPTVGTGTITLNAPAVGYQSFAAAGVVNGDTVRYAIEDGTAWEIGSGTYSASGTTITRNPTQSSNGGTTISLTGAAVIYGTATADDFVSSEAIAASKAITAVDGFVYDTSKDSDGGAWRKRTQGTSWYNETLNTATRGARREFPAVAVIVAESNKVTIYDGDDPALPMWMVFNQGTYTFIRSTPITSVSMLNGLLVVGGTSYGISVTAFTSDENISSILSTALQSRVVGGIVNRNNTTAGNRIDGLYYYSSYIVNANVNDVAMTVLPDAPIDPATGLQVPTIAVATAGGVSVIKDDGTVVDYVGSSQPSPVTDVAWTKDNKLVIVNDYQATLHSLISSDDTGPYFSQISSYITRVTNTTSHYNPLFPSAYGANFNTSGVITAGVDTAVAGTSSAVSIATCWEAGATGNHLSAYITSKYNTGWMNGNIKGAFLSDTSATALVGSGELVTNGTFDTDVSGWNNYSDTRGTISWDAGTLKIVNDGTGNAFAGQQITGLVIGQTYVLTGNITASVGTNPDIRVGNSFGTGNLGISTSGVGFKSVTFKPQLTSAWIQPSCIGGVGSGVYANFDNISVKLADADRSVNNKGLIVNGTVTRTAVATGADLVAYSGFSAANYLEQPYNSALDFGTGDFCVMGWVKASAATRYIFDRADAAYTGGRISLYRASAGNIRATLTGTANLDSGVELNDKWQFVVLKRASGVLYLSVNAGTPATAANTSVLSNATATTRLGLSVGGLFPCGSMALWRISATAESAAGIAKIYNDEKFLFQDGAQATLYGTSDAVTALAYDDDTNLLSVGTSAGRSDFQGLRRVANTTTAVSTFISASGKMIVEQ